jgi:hypothetical protein
MSDNSVARSYTCSEGFTRSKISIVLLGVNGLISFNDEGAILFSPQLAQEDRDALGFHDHLALRRVAARRLPNLAWHRTFLFGSNNT